MKAAVKCKLLLYADDSALLASSSDVSEIEEILKRELESVSEWLSENRLSLHLDWRQCGNSLALCYFAVVMELPVSLWMNCKSEFGVIFLRCSPK